LVGNEKFITFALNDENDGKSKGTDKVSIYQLPSYFSSCHHKKSLK